MSEQKDKVSIKEETDVKETNGSIEELTAVVKECVVAIKQLERGLNDFYKMQSLTFKDFNNSHIQSVVRGTQV
ncbi:hypothetical protein A9485_08625 [Bacillus cereus]|uniref:hypothetical protein n=1 Tax=Bacillus cereus TaxID=1396 RepID=UPI0008FE12A9|nr:hypothetical protein [Bacillus cereus]OJD90288.1 hypothetical protein A9485_08625 [Bacillus cereus]